MLGQMMELPLLISDLIQHADREHGDTEIVSRTIEGGIHRYTYSDAHRRSRQLANVLIKLGVKAGDRVATLAWNTHRHLELFYAVSGSGAVCHTVNPRLFAEQIAYILNHGAANVLFVDLTFVPLVEKLLPQLGSLRTVVILAPKSHMPGDALPDALCYEELLAAASDRFEWPQLDERMASSLCYTSGTSGAPKGVLYSHRSTVLHSLAVSLPDAMNLSARDVMLPVTPMFHVNAWGLSYACALVGAKLVLPGAGMDGASLHQLMETEAVTVSAGVPTVWLGLLQHMERNHLRFSTMRRTIIGGSAAPPAMVQSFEQQYGVEVRHAWGMTETSPLVTACAPKLKHAGHSPQERQQLQIKQGRTVFGAAIRIVGDSNEDLPRDGRAFGELLVRGHWVCRQYFGVEGLQHMSDGWFRTGDVATIDADGYMHITDRRKDVIKSGGEWISSIELENAAMSHPDVAEAAVIGVPHPKWDERPLLLVVRKPGTEADRQQILEFLRSRVAKWWLPDDVLFVDALPHTATGKLLKTELRKQYCNHRWPS